MQKPKTLYLFENGNCACGDETGQQIPELQVSMLHLWCLHAVSRGYDPEGTTLKTELADLRITKNSGGIWTTVPI